MLNSIAMNASQYQSLHIIGIILGWIVVAGILASAMNYFIKIINRKYVIELPADSSVRKGFPGVMKAIMRMHPYIGLYLITILALHFFSVLGHHGLGAFSWTGLAAAALMVTQVGIGSYGVVIRSRKRGPWFYVHRINAALMGAAIIVHVANVIIWPPQ
jgi:hypothetical protein